MLYTEWKTCAIEDEILLPRIISPCFCFVFVFSFSRISFYQLPDRRSLDKVMGAAAACKALLHATLGYDH